jgi:hypothetical protein
MLAKYAGHFAALTPEAEGMLASAVSRRHGIPQPIAGSLYAACEAAGLDQADVVLSLANSPEPLAVVALETVVGKPIQMGWPALRGKQRDPATGQPKERPEPKTKMQRVARPSKTDPRKIVAVVPNPKKPGSASFDRFALYVVGMTVTQALAAGVKSADIDWDSARGFIKFEESVQ